MRGTAQRHDSAVLSAPQDALRAESGPREKGTLPPEFLAGHIPMDKAPQEAPLVG